MVVAFHGDLSSSAHSMLSILVIKTAQRHHGLQDGSATFKKKDEEADSLMK